VSNPKDASLSDLQLAILIFVSFFKIALFVIGGGLAMIPVIEQIFVQERKLLKSEDMLDMIAIMQTMPGMMAVNAAIFVGHKLLGFKGAAIASIAVILPSIGIIILIAFLFQNLDVKNPHILKSFSCVRACVVAIFLGTAYRLAKNVFKGLFDYIIVFLFIGLLLCGFSQIALILLSLPIGWLYIIWTRIKKVRKE
jgi:chromate transporter